MLPLKNRIKKRKDFESVFKNGKSLFSEIAVIKILKNDSNITRFGFIVSRKVSLKAVERNRIKRKMREQIRLRLSRFEKGMDIIIIARKNIIRKKSKELGDFFEKLFVENEALTIK